MNFTSYFVLSSLVVFGVMSHAYVVHEQFYPAVVYLSTDKMCLAVMYNFAFALFLLFGKVLLKTFIGTLRDLEVEQLVDSGRGFLADTILFLVFYAPTIDNREVGTVYLIQYICCVIFMKVFHLTTQIRVSHMFEVGVPRFIVNAKLVALMCFLLTMDKLALQYFYNISSRSSTFFTWVLFEALTMSTVVVVSICKYSVHMVDIRLDNGWPAKSVCLFYIDLVHDVVSMTLFLVFMLTFFVQNPSRLPIYMMADVIQVARKLAQRLRSFRRYRRISNNMEARFADATDEEIEANEHCVICRDSLFEGSRAKKLACGHIFHIDCLRSWLVMQQVCPTCRAEIPPDGPLAGPGSGERQLPPVAEAAAVPDAAPAAAAAGVAAPGATVAPAAAPGAAASGPAVAATVAPSLGYAAPAASLVGAQLGGAAAAAPAFPASGGSQPAVSTAAASAAAFAAAFAGPQIGGLGFGDSGIFGSTLGALPAVHDIVESLRRAEDVSKFLRQQQDFWMQQVTMIQRQTPMSSGLDSSGLLAPPSLLTLPGSMGASAPARVPAASVPAPAAPAAAAPGAVVSPVAVPAPVAAPAKLVEAAAERTTPVRDSFAAAAPENVFDESPSSPSGAGMTRVASTGSAQDQMAELRRAQKAEWERKRTMSQQSIESAVDDKAVDEAVDDH